MYLAPQTCNNMFNKLLYACFCIVYEWVRWAFCEFTHTSIAPKTFFPILGAAKTNARISIASCCGVLWSTIWGAYLSSLATFESLDASFVFAAPGGSGPPQMVRFFTSGQQTIGQLQSWPCDDPSHAPDIESREQTPQHISTLGLKLKRARNSIKSCVHSPP